MALVGNSQTALDLLGDSTDFKSGIARASLLIKLGRPEEAISLLDKTSQSSKIESYYVFLTMSKAFLHNNEPKSAQVCLNEASKIWD